MLLPSVFHDLSDVFEVMVVVDTHIRRLRSHRYVPQGMSDEARVPPADGRMLVVHLSVRRTLCVVLACAIWAYTSCSCSHSLDNPESLVKSPVVVLPKCARDLVETWVNTLDKCLGAY